MIEMTSPPAPAFSSPCSYAKNSQNQHVMSVNTCNPLLVCTLLSVSHDAHTPGGISSVGYSAEMLISTIQNVSVSMSYCINLHLICISIRHIHGMLRPPFHTWVEWSYSTASDCERKTIVHCKKNKSNFFQLKIICYPSDLKCLV